jgi:hypothetical protein
MNRTKTAAGIVAAAAALSLATAPAWAQTGDLDCGDPGTYLNMPVPPDDPNDLDRDGDGIGCDNPDDFGPDGQPVVDAPAEPEAPAPAPPAPAVVEEPDYTG